MREIKFRAWDGEDMLEAVNVEDMMFSCGFNYDHVPWIGRSDSRHTAAIIMQFTGLTDKNGVDIYENDLVLVRESRICEVVWHDHAGCWDLIPRNIISSLSIGSVAPASFRYHTEILGNIHENSELLA